MKMFLKVLLIIVVIMVVGIGGLYLSWHMNDDIFNYEEALEEAITFLEDNEEELDELAKEYLENHEMKSKKFKIVNSINYSDTDGIKNERLENVVFDCKVQGILGGQSWGLLHIPSNEYLGEKELYIYDEKEFKSDGNNVFIRKKIKKNWFFYYDDWDGKVNLKKVK